MSPIIRSLLTSLGIAGTPLSADAPLFQTLSPNRADLSDLRWQVRPVLVFAEDNDDPAYLDQIAALRAAEDGLRERDILVMTDTKPRDLGSLRTGLAIDAFTVVLIGKDGGVKLRQNSPLTVDSLFATIDQMPMRQREMRED